MQLVTVEMSDSEENWWRTHFVVSAKGTGSPEMSSNMRGLGSVSKRVCAVGIASLCLVVIPGCSMFTPPPPEWSIQVLDGKFSLAFCESSVSDEIIASVEDSTGEVLWRVDEQVASHAQVIQCCIAGF